MASIEQAVPNATDTAMLRRKASPEVPRALVTVARLSKFFPVSRGLFRKPAYARAVDGVSLHVDRAETLGLVGESGCGKTTLGRAILRLIEPTYGRTVYDGIDLSRMPQRELRPLRRHMQIIFQDPYSSLNPRMHIGEIVGEGLLIHGLVKSKDAYRKRVAELLEQVGLPANTASRFPHEFSAGQRQRVGIARALAVEPSFVICDEPVSALDASIQAQSINLLRSLQETNRISYLFISHDLRLVHHISHRVAVMYLGQIVETAKTAALFSQPLHPYTRALLSAIPVPDPRHRHLRIVLDGEQPSPSNPPTGCPFHPRCPKSDKDLCVSQRPTLEELESGSGHRVACWYPQTRPISSRPPPPIE